jgi:hypothetical protein
MRYSGTLMRRTLLVLATVVLLVLPLGSVTAQEDDAPNGALLLIMDSSGSMNDVDDQGVPLIDGAKQALRVLVSALPEDARVGLRVYGHRVPNTDKANGCRDTELVIPVGPLDPDAIQTAIDSYEAKGFTPIGLSLQEAAADLGGPGTIVLVSDGVDTCAPPDPCDVAASLMEQGFDLTVHTVGLFLDDPAAERQLQCIADATGGSFTRADSIVDLIRGLTGLATEAIGVEIPNPVLIGALDRLEAPVMTLGESGDPNWPARGAVVSGMIGSGETRWYAVDVPAEGTWQVQASAVLNDWPLEPAAADYLELQIYDAEGEPLGMPHEVLGVAVETPQRLSFEDAAEWFPFGDALQVIAVTDPHSAPPGWPGSEADDPYMARMAERLVNEGLNRGLYELWATDGRTPPLDPGRYYIGVTYVSEESSRTEIAVGASLYPSPDVPPERTVAGEPVLIDASGALEVLELSSWDSDALEGGAGVIPSRSGEAWTRLPQEGSRLLVDLAKGETLAIGFMMGPVFTSERGFVDPELRDPGGSVVPSQYDPEDDGLWIPGYEAAVYRWDAPADGRYELTVRPIGGGEPSDQAAILAAFVLAPTADPAPTTTSPDPEEPTQAAAVDGGEEKGGPGIPVGPIGIGVGTALALGAGVAWWLRRRRTG